MPPPTPPQPRSLACCRIWCPCLTHRAPDRTPSCLIFNLAPKFHQLSIQSTQSKSWVSEGAGFGCGLGMTYAHKGGSGEVAGGTSLAPCPTPITAFPRLCASSATSRRCYNLVETMTLPMFSTGFTISWKKLRTSNASVLCRLWVSRGFSFRKLIMRCAVAPQMSHRRLDKVVHRKAIRVLACT